MLLERFQCDMESGRFRSHRGKSYRTSARHVPAAIVSLHNRAAAMGGRILRPLVEFRSLARYRHFLSLTPTTQQAMIWFEDCGARASVKGRNAGSMTVATRRMVVNEAFALLRRLSLDGLEKVDAVTIEQMIPRTGPEDRNYRRITRLLNAVAALFRSCVAQGKLVTNPVAGIANNTFTVYGQRDFLDVADVDKLRDLSTVDRKDTGQVVDRLIVLVLLDSCLRRNELASLDLSQVRKSSGGYQIELRPENQKMAGKPAVVLPLLYPESQRLLEFYLTGVRGQVVQHGVDALMVDRRGYGASGTAIAAAVRREGQRLGIRTYYKKSAPSPHDLRRTFAMCNASPLGFDMHPHELADRLRDDIQVVFTHYVRNNPLIAARRAEKYRERTRPEDGVELARKLVGQLEKLGVRPDLLAPVRADLERMEAGRGAAGREGDERKWIPEAAALAQVSGEWRSVPTLRRFREFLRRRHAQRRSHGNSCAEYDAAEIRWLVDTYVPAADLASNAAIDAKSVERLCTDAEAIKIGTTKLVPRKKAWTMLNGVGSVPAPPRPGRVRPQHRNGHQASSPSASPAHAA
jgi:site-specific recombinase XerC